MNLRGTFPTLNLIPSITPAEHSTTLIHPDLVLPKPKPKSCTLNPPPQVCNVAHPSILGFLTSKQPTPTDMGLHVLGARAITTTIAWVITVADIRLFEAEMRCQIISRIKASLYHVLDAQVKALNPKP
jgi:hypothetical protein